MTDKEYVTSYVLGDRLVNVGLDDYGQCYFIEWAENGEIKQESCGSYNTNYKEYLEYKFGEPAEHCELYPKEGEYPYETVPPLEDCKERGKYGFCDKCKYNDLKWHSHKLLVELGIIDRRGNLLGPYKDIFVRKDENN